MIPPTWTEILQIKLHQIFQTPNLKMVQQKPYKLRDTNTGMPQILDQEE